MILYELVETYHDGREFWNNRVDLFLHENAAIQLQIEMEHKNKDDKSLSYRVDMVVVNESKA